MAATMKMNNGAAYQLQNFTGVLTHSWQPSTFVKDELQNIDLLVRSGDYFVTLATQLDTLINQIDDNVTVARIETIVADLLYLQHHYNITKNNGSE
jgi:hypothetical protein